MARQKCWSGLTCQQARLILRHCSDVANCDITHADLSTPAQQLSTVNEPCGVRMHHIFITTQPVLFSVGLVPVVIVLRKIGAFWKNQEVWWVLDVTEMLQCVRQQLLILMPVPMDKHRVLHLHCPAYKWSQSTSHETEESLVCTCNTMGILAVKKWWNQEGFSRIACHYFNLFKLHTKISFFVKFFKRGEIVPSPNFC